MTEGTPTDPAFTGPVVQWSAHDKFMLRSFNALHLHYFIQASAKNGVTLDANELMAVAEAQRLRRTPSKGETGYLWQLASGEPFWVSLDGRSYSIHPLAH